MFVSQEFYDLTRKARSFENLSIQKKKKKKTLRSHLKSKLDCRVESVGVVNKTVNLIFLGRENNKKSNCCPNSHSDAMCLYEVSSSVFR